MIRRHVLVMLASLVLSACSASPLVVPDRAAETLVEPAPSGDVVPAGIVRVAYPEEPAAWHPALYDDPAAVDLAALWGLPLYRLDASGQPHPALALSAEVVDVPEGWGVEVTLATGTWSDGSAVTSADVVATIESLRASPRSAEFAAVVTAVAVTPDRVRFEFAVPYLRWQYLLAGGMSVMPAGTQLESYRDGVPVAGGPYRLESRDPGLVSVFVANPESPMGAPGVERIEVYVTPDYDTALALLRDDRVDVVMGYLALNPVGRADVLEGVTAAAPLGGTWLGVQFRSGGSYGGAARAERRLSIARSLDVASLVEGLLGEAGAIADGEVPGPAAGVAAAPAPVDLSDLPEPTLVIPTWQETTSFTARALQRSLGGRGGSAVLARYEPDELYTVLDTVGDAALVVRRQGPRPSLAGRVLWEADGLSASVAAADGSLRRDGAAQAEAAAALSRDLAVIPLYRIGVAQVWRDGLTGVRPSSYPGLAWWDVQSWRIDVAGDASAAG